MKTLTIIVILGAGAIAGIVSGIVWAVKQKKPDDVGDETGELLNQQLVVDTLTIDEIKPWFLENAKECEQPTGVIMKLTPQLAKVICGNQKEELDTGHYLLQGIYNGPTETINPANIVRMRLINFNTIGGEVSEKLNEAGLILIKL